MTMLNLEKIYEYLKTGELELAKKNSLTLLKKQPNNIELLHILGMISAEQGNFQDAIQYLTSAINTDRNNLTLQLHLANTFKKNQQFTEAESLLKKIIDQHPNYIPALNNLGNLYYSHNKLTEAEQYYLRILDIDPKQADAFYHLGLTFTKQKKFQTAIETYQRLLKLIDNHFPARFQLACLFMQTEKIRDAIKEFLIIEQTHPYHFETQSNLATCYLKQNAFKEAKQHYLKAIALSPDDTQILFNLGVVYMQLGEIDFAIQQYQKAVNIDPDFFAAHNNLGVAFLAKQHPMFALPHFKEALRLQPDNGAIRYTVKVLSRSKPLLTAPSTYITTLFDSYADHYEQHLLQALDYQVPILLQQAIFNIKKPSEKSLSILDLGCGTGLCGEIFKGVAKELIGVDLSEKMLEIAKQKNCYDALFQEDIITFLANKISSYDLILAGDVVVYIGDLTHFFQSAYNALRMDGLLAFNTEISTTDDYQMNQSGRFSHTKNYIEQLAAPFFKVKYYSQEITRTQNNESVYGHIFVLEKIVQ